MNRMIMFENISNIGDLYLAHSFLDFESEPILFVCTNNNGKFFLCICSEIRVLQRWIVVSTDLHILQKLIENTIDIHSAFTDVSQSIRLIIEYSTNNELTSKHISVNDIHSDDLPVQGIYLKYFDKDEALAYIKSYDHQQTNFLTIQKKVSFIKKTIPSFLQPKNAVLVNTFISESFQYSCLEVVQKIHKMKMYSSIYSMLLNIDSYLDTLNETIYPTTSNKCEDSNRPTVDLSPAA